MYPYMSQGGVYDPAWTYGSPMPAAMPAAMPMPYPVSPYAKVRHGLPASVITAGILMLIFGTFWFLGTTISLIDDPGASPLWLSMITYLAAVLVLAAPIFMLMRKRWAYSVSFSVLFAIFILLALEAIGILGTVAVFEFAAFPIVAIVFIVAGVIVGTPMTLLITKSARRAFEGERDPSAIVWAGGGYEMPWQQPFALHPDEMPSMGLVPVAWAPMPYPAYGAYPGY